MNDPHNINDPFENIINQIKTSVDCADTGKVPYTPEQVMTMASDLIFVTGYFTAACHIWNQKPEVDKTWVEFKIYFSKEHHVCQHTQPTSAGVI